MPQVESKSQERPQKRIFIISPIGDPGSEIRIYFDKVKRHIIDRAAEEKGYVTERAEGISKPGRITTQIVDRLLNDELVVADITENNPNVFYELAVRHAIGKPVILIGKNGEIIPFDVSAQRVIFYDLNDPDSVEASRDELIRQISAVDAEDFIVDSPIRESIPLERPERAVSGEIILTEILAIVRNTSEQIQKLTSPEIKGVEEIRLAPVSRTRMFQIIKQREELEKRNMELSQMLLSMQRELERSRVNQESLERKISELEAEVKDNQ